MTSRDDFDRHLEAWLIDRAPMYEPEPLLGQILARTARTRRRPAWLIPERWIPMSTITGTATSISRFPMRTAGLVALLVLALVVGAILVVGARRPALPAPFGPAGNGQILSVEGGDIAIRDSLDAIARPLVTGEAEDVGPWLSNDGTRFTFFRISGDERNETIDLWVAAIDGSGQRHLAGPFLEPSGIDWSPSGDVVVVNDTPEGGLAQMWMVNTDGSGSSLLDVGMPATVPTFRPPDGSQISFVGEHPRDGHGLYLVGRDGTGLRRLALAPFADPDPTAAYLDEPAWSPGGDRLAFHSRDVSPGSPEGRSLRVKIADVDPAGSVTGERMLTDDPVAESEFEARWLPTGDAVVYKRLVNAMQRLAIAPVALAPAAPRDITAGNWLDGVTIAPDGRSLLYLDDVGGVTHVDIASGLVTPAGFVTDDIVVWQRTAAP